MKTAKAIDVIENRARWSAECADALEWLAGLPDDSVDLLVTSPPYMGARTYGIGFNLAAGEWAAWMVKVVEAASPKVKGLIAINCEGQTKDYAYQPAPFLLVTDLYRAGFNLRKPPVFHRVGIPGSGGPDWLRNDYEPVVCVTRPGRLPWSDNVACGHEPKWRPGGNMSHRLADGERANPWYRDGKALGARRPNGKKRSEETPACASKKTLRKMVRTKQSPGREDVEESYTPPVLANPGNVISIPVGGGMLGHALSHENEAPFPLDLPAFFIKSFCPPGGIVADCFSGSGTTIHAALDNGRRGIGCDARESQVELTCRRISTVTASMFSEPDGT